MSRPRTYGIHGLMEWRGVFPLGRTSIAIDFSGGTFSGLGHTPATFTTSDRAIQHIIETSEHFRSGRVKRILSVFDRLEEQQQHNPAAPPEPEPECGKITYEASDPNDAADWLETQALISTEGITDPERLIELAAANSITLSIGTNARTKTKKT